MDGRKAHQSSLVLAGLQERAKAIPVVVSVYVFAWRRHPAAPVISDHAGLDLIHDLGVGILLIDDVKVFFRHRTLKGRGGIVGKFKEIPAIPQLCRRVLRLPEALQHLRLRQIVARAEFITVR